MQTTITKLYIVSIFLLSACSHQEAHNERHEHETMIQTHTLFCNNYELYMANEYPTLKEPCSFIIHITELRSYKPISKGQLQISIIDKNNVALVKEMLKLSHRGIFEYSFKPTANESYTVNVKLFEGDEQVADFTMQNFKVYADHEAIEKSIHVESSANEIAFSKEQAWSTTFAIQQVSKDDFFDVVHTSGVLTIANNVVTTVVAPTSGIVQFNTELLLGMDVSKDNQLLTLTGEGLATNNIAVRYTLIKSNYEKAKKNFERSKNLMKERLVSEKEFLNAKTEYEQAKVEFEGIVQKEGGNIPVYSPINGSIYKLEVNNGEFVEAGRSLLSVAQNNKLLLKADVPQKYWSAIPNISSANFITNNGEKTYNTNELGGKLISKGKTVSGAIGSIPIFFEIKNDSGLIPGSYAEIFLLGNPEPNTISIPNSALIEEQGNYYVFIQTSGESYLKQEVKLGRTNGKSIEVLAGLSEGETIVTQGALHVKLASASSELPAHNHSH